MDVSYDLTQAPVATSLAIACAMMAAVLDHRRGFIPNSLTYPCLLAGLMLAGVTGGIGGLGLSLAGLVASALIFLIAFIAGSCGGGDVKLMAALGAILGLWPATDVMLASMMVGGVIAVFLMLKRMQAVAVMKTVSLFVILLPAGIKDAAAVLVPRERHTVRFGVAAAGGLMWCLFLPQFAPLAFVR